MSWKEAEYQAYQQRQRATASEALCVATTQAIKARACQPLPYANKLEAAYAAHLEAQKRAGMLLDWCYQPLRLILADRTTYEPDFLVITMERLLLFDETKGFWRDDARVKIKVAARLFPWFTFRAITRKSAKAPWQIETL